MKSMQTAIQKNSHDMRSSRMHMRFRGPHSLLWFFAFAWAVCFLLLLVNDGTEQNPVLMILALTELAIHAVWILLDRRY